MIDKILNVPEGHPVHTYLAETKLIHELIYDLQEVHPKEDFQKFFNIFTSFAPLKNVLLARKTNFFLFLKKMAGTVRQKTCGRFMIRFGILSEL